MRRWGTGERTGAGERSEHRGEGMVRVSGVGRSKRDTGERVGTQVRGQAQVRG